LAAVDGGLGPLGQLAFIAHRSLSLSALRTALV
jgi:hypothetical protein